MHIFIFFAVLSFIFAPTVCFSAEKEVVLETASGSLHGSLRIPDGQKHPPVVLIISGSGPTDRNGNQQKMQNNSLQMLADSLEKEGVASLRYDKRGVGASKIENLDARTLTFETFVQDAEGWMEWLKKEKLFSKYIVAGHSEGSLVALLTATRIKVDGFISIAGAGRPIHDIIKEQLNEQPQQIKDLVYPRLDTLQGGDTLSGVPTVLYALFNPAVQPFLMSWMKYDPSAEIKKLSIPVLILQGSTDIQVAVKDAEALKSAYPAAELKIIDSMNHILKFFPSRDKQAQVSSYNDPNLPLHQSLMKPIVTFIKSIK